MRVASAFALIALATLLLAASLPSVAAMVSWSV
jgi:hypothetical protein